MKSVAIIVIKQDALAFDLDMSQQAISLLEQKETLDAHVLEKVAKILGVPEDAIKSFSEETAVPYFNTFNDSSFANSNGAFSPSNCTFHPLDKVVELYERMLQIEKEKNELLQKLLNKFYFSYSIKRRKRITKYSHRNIGDDSFS